MDLKKLEKWWWSPDHPFNYTATNPETGEPAGLGILLRRFPEHMTRFNAVWMVYGELLKTWEGAQEGVFLSGSLRARLDVPALGGTLGELSCLYTKPQFLKYCSENKVKLQLPQPHKI